MADDPERLRARAVRLFGMAIQVRDIEPGYAEKLIAEAIELQERATAMENAAHASGPPDGSQRAVQQQEQVPLKKLSKT